MGRLSCQSMVCATVWLILGMAFAGMTPAQAAPELFVDLRYDVDPALPGCSTDSELRSMLAGQLGYDPHRGGAGLRVEVRVRSADQGLQGTIDWSAPAQGPLGQRQFVSGSRDCSAMLATMGFALAVQIQLMAREPTPEASLESADADKGTLPSPPRNHPVADNDQDKTFAAPPQATVSQASPESSAPSSTPWSVAAGVGPSAGLGLGPDPVAQGRLFLSAQLGQAALELGVEASLPSTTRQEYGGGFRHRLLLGTAAVCGLRGSTSLCAVGKLGQIGVQGVGVDKPASPDGLVAQLGPRLAYAIGLGDHLALVGHADALCLLTSWTVTLNRVTVWTMPRLSAVAGIDLVARFW